MRTRERTGLWLLAAALLASVEFSYAHLQQVGFWPLQVMVSSIWRLVGARDGTADSGAALWGPPMLLIGAGLLAEILASWTRRRPLWRKASEGDDHE